MPRTITVTALILRRGADASPHARAVRLRCAAMDEGTPRGSVSLYAGRELEMVRSGCGHVLRYGTTTVARLEGADAETADGRWSLASRRGAAIDARDSASGELVATYRPGVVGGRIRVAGGGRYTLRPPVLGDRWRLRRRGRRRALATFVGPGEWDATLAADAAEEPDLALVVVVALRALLIEALMPHSPHAAGG